MELNKEFWDTRYLENNTPWDIGYVSPPIKKVIDDLDDKELRILIPGAGRAYEAIYAHRLGFSNIIVCDWAEHSFEFIKQEAEDFPAENLVLADFFSLDREFDLIIEQTFFCAIEPTLRKAYVKKVHSLLVEGGFITGLLFANHFDRPGPPFGGSQSEYIKLFENYFEIEVIEEARNSILPRSGNELFFRMKKK